MKIKTNSRFVRALVAKYEAEIEEAKATLEVYFNSPVGIGEHSDLLTEHDKWAEKLANAIDKLSAIEAHFSNTEKGGDNL